MLYRLYCRLWELLYWFKCERCGKRKPDVVQRMTVYGPYKCNACCPEVDLSKIVLPQEFGTCQLKHPTQKT